MLTVDSLYSEVIRSLLRVEWKDGQLLESESVFDCRLRICSELAFRLLDSAEGASATAGVVREMLRGMVPGSVDFDRELRAIEPVLTGITGLAARTVHWGHPSLQKWLTAQHLAEAMSVDSAIDFLQARWWHSGDWQEVTVFYSGRVQDPRELLAALDRDSFDDPFLVIDQVSMGCALHCQRMDLARPAAQRILTAFGSPRTRVGSRHFAVKYLPHAGRLFPADYRKILRDKRYLRSTMIERGDPIAVDLVVQYLRRGEWRHDDSLAESAVDVLPELGDDELRVLAADLLKSVDQYSPLIQLASRVPLELLRREIPPPPQWRSVAYEWHDMSELLSVGAVDAAYDVLRSQPAGEHALGFEYIGEGYPGIAEKLVAAAADPANPLVMRMILIAAAGNQPSDEVPEAVTAQLARIARGILHQFADQVDDLWEQGFAALRPLIERTPDAFHNVTELVLFGEYAEYSWVLPEYDDGDFGVAFREALNDPNVVDIEVRRAIEELALLVHEDDDLPERLNILELELAFRGDDEVSAVETYETLRRLLGAILGDPPGYLTLLFFRQYRVDPEVIAMLAEICLRHPTTSGPECADLVLRLTRNPLCPERSRLLLLLAASEGEKIAVDELCVALAEEWGTESTGIQSDLVEGMTRSESYPLGPAAKSAARVERNALRRRILEAATRNWSSDKWRVAYPYLSAMAGSHQYRGVFEELPFGRLATADLQAILRAKPPRAIGDPRLADLVRIDGEAARPIVARFVRAHLAGCPGWPYCRNQQDWPVPFPAELTEVLDTDMQRRFVSHSYDPTTDACAGDREALNRLEAEYVAARERDSASSPVGQSLRDSLVTAARNSSAALEVLTECVSDAPDRDKNLVRQWAKLRPETARRKLDDWVYRGIVSADEFDLLLLHLGSRAAWRRSINKYLAEKRDGEGRTTFWYEIKRDRFARDEYHTTMRMAPFFLDLANAASSGGNAEVLAPTLLEAYLATSNELSQEEAAVLREVLSPLASRIREALAL